MASILIKSKSSYNNSGYLLSLESNPLIAEQLQHNRDLNNFNFDIEPSALSKRHLIQQGWNTIESTNINILEGYFPINTITLEELYKKYPIKFDTLILDCEGAFYYILTDIPEILNGINLIIMENDYWDISRKIYIDKILLLNGFSVIYTEVGGWGPCYQNFYEVWKR